MEQNMQGYPMMQQSQMPPPEQPTQIQNVTEPKKSKSWLWILLLILLIFGAATYYFFFM